MTANSTNDYIIQSLLDDARNNLFEAATSYIDAADWQRAVEIAIISQLLDGGHIEHRIAEQTPESVEREILANLPGGFSKRELDELPTAAWEFLGKEKIIGIAKTVIDAACASQRFNKQQTFSVNDDEIILFGDGSLFAPSFGGVFSTIQDFAVAHEKLWKDLGLAPVVEDTGFSESVGILKAAEERDVQRGVRI